MGEVVIKVAKWALMAAFIIGIAISIGVLLTIIVSYLIIGFNMSVLNDIFALVQMWLPFNLNVILGWIAISTTAYLAYLLSVKAYMLLSYFLA